MSLSIEKSMTIDALREIVPHQKMNEAFIDLDIHTTDGQYTYVAKGLFNLVCGVEFGQSKQRLLLVVLGLASDYKGINTMGKRFLWIAYSGRL
jgi:hypothetical protein